MMFHTTEKTETCHGNSSPEPQCGSSWQKLALLFSFTSLC